MAKRKKTKQENAFDGIKTTALPITKKNAKRLNSTQESSSNVVKRPRVIASPEDIILPHFRTSMNDFIKSKLTTIVRDAKETQISKKIEDFKNKSLKDKRLPNGIMTTAATMSGCSPNVQKTTVQLLGQKQVQQKLAPIAEKSRFIQALSDPEAIKESDKDLKLKWNTHPKDAIFDEIQAVKRSEYEALINSTKVRKELKDQRSLQHIKRMALRRLKLLQTESGKLKLSVANVMPDLFNLESSDQGSTKLKRHL
ncbi:hypothetical protein HPULCUR_002188 [Helicostylum pulchrum]|uniref:Uncharacterized protein n=1 Tax=Helicostylum pulchrum TaxID=562976 RepID=A0ABP9XR29_9FUNG